MKWSFWRCPRCGAMLIGSEAIYSHRRQWIHDWARVRRVLAPLAVILLFLAFLGTFEPNYCREFSPDAVDGPWVERECTWDDTFWGKLLP